MSDTEQFEQIISRIQELKKDSEDMRKLWTELTTTNALAQLREVV